MAGPTAAQRAFQPMAAAWRRLSEAVAQAPVEVWHCSETELAEGFEYWAQVVTFALRRELHYGDTSHPMFHRIGFDTKIGFDNPDNVYQIAKIDPGRSYRVTGTRGTAQFLEFSVSVGFPGVVVPPRTVSKLDTTEISCGADGTLDVIVGGDFRPHNWLAVDDEATSVLVRQVFGEWREDDVCGDFRITPLDGDWHGTRTEPLDPRELSRRVDAAATFVETQTRYWLDYVDGLRSRISLNTFEAPGVQGQQLVQVNAARAFFCWGRYEVAPGEALIVEIEAPPPEAYLGFHLVNHWLQSLDYAGRITSLNNRQAQHDSDGRIRYVLAHDDPGVPNWLDIGGHPSGGMLFRTALTASAAQPQTRQIAASHVRDALPDDTPSIDPASRREQIRARRDHVASRFRW